MNLTLQDSKYYIDKQFYLLQNKTSEEQSEHTHDFVELNYTLKGVCRHKIDGIEYVTKKGDLLFINYGKTHSFKPEGAVKHAELLVKPDFVSQSLIGTENAFALLSLKDFAGFDASVNKENCFIHFNDSEQRTVEALIELICHEQDDNACGQSLLLHSSLNILLTVIFRKMALPLSDRLMIGRELLSYIKDNCSSDIKMSDIAEKCFYAPSYLSRKFKALAGCTYSEYLRKCRLDKACSLLLETDEKIEDIIVQAGFSDRTKFFKSFVEYKGVTPLQYRKSKK